MESIGYYINDKIAFQIHNIASNNGVPSDGFSSIDSESFFKLSDKDTFVIRDNFLHDNYVLPRPEAVRFHLALLASGAHGSSTCFYSDCQVMFLVSEQLFDSSILKKRECRIVVDGGTWAQFEYHNRTMHLGAYLRSNDGLASFIATSPDLIALPTGEEWEDISNSFSQQGFRGVDLPP